MASNSGAAGLRQFGARLMIVLAILTGLTVAALAYCQTAVPASGKQLARSEAFRYWWLAVGAAMAVLVVDLMIVVTAVMRWRRQ